MAKIRKAGFTYPGTTTTRTVEGAVTSAATTPSEAAVLFMPIIAPKGRTDEYMMFEGTYAEFIKEFGEYSVKKHGIPFKMATEHVRAGGRLGLINLRAEDATIANSILCVTSTSKTKVIYVDTDGKLYNEEPTDGTETKSVTLNTYALAPTFQTVADAKNADDLSLAVKSLKVMSSPLNMVLPYAAFMSRGRGKYGNNIEMYFEKTTTLVNNAYREYNLVIYDKAEKVTKESWPVTPAMGVYENATTPVSMSDVLDTYSGAIKQITFDDYIDEYDSLFTIMLTNIMAQLRTEIDTNSITELEAVYTTLSDIKETYENNIQDVPAMNLFDFFGQMEDGFINVLFDLPSDRIWSTALASGSDGYLASMRRFDWDFETKVNANAPASKVLISLYNKAFSGAYGDTLYDFNLMPIDYILDPDFPVDVKKTVAGLTEERIEILYLASAPTAITTVAELKSFHKVFNPENINVYKFPCSGTVMDTIESKKFRLTTPHGMLEWLATFYTKPLTPLSGRYITAYDEKSVYPVITADADAQWCYEQNFNYLSFTSQGYMLDGQNAALAGYEHPIKELHNGMLTTRLVKEMMDFLNRNRHILQSGNAIQELKDKAEDAVLKRYRNKGLTISYNVKYANDLERKRGRLTDELIVEGPRTDKVHNLLIRLTNNG